MTVSSRDVRAELLGMGYREEEVTEQDVRGALRRLLAVSLLV